MHGKIIFYDDSIINLIGVILFGFLTALPVLFSIWIIYLKFNPESRAKMYLKKEWENVPNVIILYFVIGIICGYGLWWEATRIDSIEYRPDNTLVIWGFFGTRLADFPVSDMTGFDQEARSYKTGYGNTYKLTIHVRDKEFITRPLNFDEYYELKKKLKKIMAR